MEKFNEKPEIENQQKNKQSEITSLKIILFFVITGILGYCILIGVNTILKNGYLDYILSPKWMIIGLIGIFAAMAFYASNNFKD